MQLIEQQDLANVLLLDLHLRTPSAVENALMVHGGCNVIRVDSVKDAIQKITAEAPALIISEWKLADYSALDLLRVLQSFDEWKNIPVLIVSDVSAREILRQTQNFNLLGVQNKPVDSRILSGYLDELINVSEPEIHREDLLRVDIRGKIKNIQHLTPLPSHIKAVMEMSDNPETSSSMLADIIQNDPSLTARILKTVNSAYYGFNREVGNINRAIIILGFDEIKDLALTSIKQSFPRGYNELFDWDKFWVHSLGVAYTARALSVKTPDIKPDDAFVAGLLHDFGKIVMDLYFKDTFQFILKETIELNQSLNKTEKKLIHIDHAEIGGLVAENWNLPVQLVKAIRYHHNPAIAGQGNSVIHLVHTANVLCHHLSIGNSGNPISDVAWRGSLQFLGLEDTSFEELWEELGIDRGKLEML